MIPLPIQQEPEYKVEARVPTVSSVGMGQIMGGHNRLHEHPPVQVHSAPD